MNFDGAMDFADLIANIPVGVCKFLLDDTLTLIYGNPSFFQMYGYTQEQFQEELGNQILYAICEEERVQVWEVVAKPMGVEKKSFRLEHRAHSRDGSTRWVLVSGYFISNGEQQYGHGVVINITEQKQLEEKLRIDEERFRLAFAQTDSTIFDYDLATRVMIHADKAATSYGIAQITKNVPDSLVEAGVIYPDSVTNFLEMYQQIHAGEKTASCVILAKLSGGDFVWRKISMTNIFDRNGKAVRAVGMLEDIDEQKRREINLQECSQRDALTGLYHKGATQNAVLARLRPVSSGILMIIDIDSFKGINDRYGHLFGDKVLAECARRISALCRSGDIIGRIGGDEFMIYLDGNSTMKTAEHKAQEICAAFHEDFVYKDVRAKVTCTVGLARTPDDGCCFENLYQKADIALYTAKKRGKNTYCLYAEGMEESVSWTPYSSTQIDTPIEVGQSESETQL